MKVYTYEDLLKAYGSVGVKRGKTVILRTDLLRLGPYENESAIVSLKRISMH